MRMMFLAAFALVVASAGAVTQLPVFCRLLAVGLQEAVKNPIITKGLNVTDMTHIPVMGDVDVSVSDFTIGDMQLVDCDAYVNEHGVFDVSVKKLDIMLTELGWNYHERRWPRLLDHGVASGNVSGSFHLSLDVAANADNVFKINLDVFDIKMGAERSTWLSNSLMRLVGLLRPVVSSVLSHEVKKTIDQSLDIIHHQGGCVFLNQMLSATPFTEFSFTSIEPAKINVPVVGDVYVSVNSTHIDQPTHMDCNHVSFSGERLVADIENVPFAAGFVWSYRKANSSFWHNSGTGEASVVASTLVNIDLIKPDSTNMHVQLPELRLTLHADEDAWLYNALTFTMAPLVRNMLNVFGSRFLTSSIKKCLENPNCPHFATLVADSQKLTHPKMADIVV